MHRNSLIVRTKYVAVLPKYALGCSSECGRQRRTQTELYFNFCRGKFMRPSVVMSTVWFAGYGVRSATGTFSEGSEKNHRLAKKRILLLNS